METLAISNVASDIVASDATISHFVGMAQNDSSIIQSVELDNPLRSLDLVAAFRYRNDFKHARLLLDRYSEKYPDIYLWKHEYALLAAADGDFDSCADYASLSLKRCPNNFVIISTLVRALALSGRCSQARDALNGIVPHGISDANECIILSQFIDFCEEFPISSAISRVRQLEYGGVYLDHFGIREAILIAMHNNKPFSLTRLGDGEGAWLSLNHNDEGRFSALYSSNRRSFLRDWFGSDRFLNDDEFYRFSCELQRDFTSSDVLGIPSVERLQFEAGLLSSRGVSTSINILRYLRLLYEFPKFKLCGSSSNLTLFSSTPLLSDIFSSGRSVSMITSFAQMSDVFKNAGLSLKRLYVVPGDSRNFHHLEGEPLPDCQFPNHLRQVETQLRANVAAGDIVFVSAGFVGKRYVDSIKRLGGIAIDVGSMADTWARNGVNLHGR